MTYRFSLCLGLAAALTLAGCSSQTPKTEQFSGFLGDYSQLQPATSASGAPVLRWLAADLDLRSYRSVLVEKPMFYPHPKPSEQVSLAALEQISAYLQQAMRRELQGRLRLVERAEQDTLVLRSAISAVDVSAQGLKVYEVIPVALLAAAASTAAGSRDRDSEIYVELEALDARSGQAVARVVRKGHGLPLENSSTQLRLDDLKPVLDSWARDARNFQP